MLTRGTPRRGYGVAAPATILADGAQRIGTDGKGNEYSWATARPVNSPAPFSAPLYLTNVPTPYQHNRTAMPGGAVPLQLRKLNTPTVAGS